ncbi:DNA/RNA non-specific endonuclease [Enterococcus sp. LJL98]
MKKKKGHLSKKTAGISFAILALLVFTVTAGQIDLNQFDPNDWSTIIDVFRETPAKKENYETLSALPDFDGGETVVEINHNQPNFSPADLSLAQGYWQTFMDLDSLNRVGQANAMLHRDFMPTEKRGDISKVYPTGWKQKKMSQGDMLYNRSHLIGYQFSGENDNWKNLMTGTQYMNQVTMKSYEQEVAKHLKETDHYVRYRVTPYFKGDEFVARGVQMEAKCVEDDVISFNVFLYNVQEGYAIDYKTGEAKAKEN